MPESTPEHVPQPAVNIRPYHKSIVSGHLALEEMIQCPAKGSCTHSKFDASNSGSNSGRLGSAQIRPLASSIGLTVAPAVTTAWTNFFTPILVQQLI